ncbi:glycoside hydrolase family 3 protein [Konateibacter massiliensis]|uniref:glycoside hydrolase family 3 protein n=1 Tax=Konateibacter massiliensis TaxID=2002841 RepID=UPI000C14C5A8|nr:glycoside hydrolase family 3 protein [Konateibacter massiliensis]
MKKNSKKGTIIWSTVLSIVLILTIVVNIVLTGPLYTVMNMYFGKGDIVIENGGETNSSDTNYYKSDYKSEEELQEASQKLAADIETEGIVLLKNENNTLPLSEDEKKVSLFGRTSVDPIYTGAGSAATESSPVDYKTALENHDFSINSELYSFYANHAISTEAKKAVLHTGMGDQEVEYTGRGFISAMGVATFVDDIIAEVPVTDYPDSLKSSYTSYNGAAVVFIGRVGGEGCDLPTDMSEFADSAENKAKTYLELNSTEMEMLAYVKAQKDAGVFDKIIVVCNTANALELGFLNDEAYGIDAAVWVGCIGDNGADAVACVLDGEVTPSGRLVDTYVYDLTKDPSFQNFEDTSYTNVDGSIGGYESGCFNEYEEGIYVGYRYYETAAAEEEAGNYEGFSYDEQVQYPFGYGLSYADFSMEFAEEPVYKDGVFTFEVVVTNNSEKWSGKQVVQIYAEAPYTPGGIEKSKVVLAAFDKTDLLKPGQSQTLTMTVEAESLASYDYKEKGCYVLESGNYQFYLSENAHSWSDIDTTDGSKYFSQATGEIVYEGDNHRSTDLIAAENQFDEVSAVFTDTKEEGSPLNMSRADFKNTFPTAPTDADKEAEEAIKAALESNFSEEENELLGNVEGSKVYTEEMPTTNASNGINLIDVRGLDYTDETWELLLDELDIKEVSNMLANAGFNTAEMTGIGKPATLDYDGPMGWSTWVSANGGDAICIGFPAEEVLAATWNEDLAYDMGLMVGEQGLYNGFNGWYAPAMNTHRSAFGGRNYEYYSEDGLLSGKMAAQEVSGAMEKGVFCYLKHFALNDKEDGRNGIATFANEQAIREIYLKPFEICVKDAKATIYYNDETGNMISKEINACVAIMSSYNRIGTKWGGGTYGLMTQILREEWGFEGAVVSDYFGGSAYMDSDEGLRAGNDMLLNTFADGSLTDSTSATAVWAMRKAAHNVLYMTANSNAMQGIASGVKISYGLAGWQKLMIAGDIIVGILLLSGAAILIRRNKNKNSVVIAGK